MSRTSYNGFRGKDSFGSVNTYEESDGTTWARITLNGVVLGYEQIGYPEDSESSELILSWPE